MCGIAGLLGTIDDENRTALGRMAAALRHRGPDGGGVWAGSPDDRGRGCLLSHRRLATSDLSGMAEQPMQSSQNGPVLVHDGAIYNGQELREELQALGRSFRSNGDAESLLAALDCWGPEAAIPRLRGMYAFALWEPSRRRLSLARDPFGIKPLYVASNPDPEGRWSLLFASELRAILASGLLERPRLDPSMLASFVWNGFAPGPSTLVQGLAMLEPGELRLLDERGQTIRSVGSWAFPEPEAPATDEPAVRTALAESVRLHLASEAPLGVFLSGGIDSSAVANLARRAAGEPIDTFTLTFEEAELNEAPAARRIAQAIGTRHHEIPLTESDFIGRLDEALASLDQPTFDGLNTFHMARAVREVGRGVALVGAGGDELFGGYRSFRDLPALQRWLGRTRGLPGPWKVRAARLAVRMLGPRRPGLVPPQTRWAKLPAIVESGGDLLELYQLSYALFLPDLQRELLREPAPPEIVAGLPARLADRLTGEIRGRSVLSALGILEQRCFLGERLLRDSDVAGMAASVELRLPLVDPVLADCVNRLPDDLRYQPIGRKALLRRVGLEGIDPGLFERPKRGFVLPMDRWIRRGLAPAIDARLRDSRAIEAIGLDGEAVGRLWKAFREGAPGLYWSRIWALFVLLRWSQTQSLTV